MIALILPTRKRPSNVRNFILYWLASHAKKSHLFVLYDEDDLGTHALVDEYGYLSDKITWIRQPFMKTVPKINSALEHIKFDRFDAIGFVGDDIEIKPSYTNHWEKEILENLKQLGKYSMVYPNDCLQGKRLPTHPFMTTELVKKLGWFAHPDFWHTKVDTVWKEIGQMLHDLPIDGGCRYLEDVMFEHLHPSINKAKDDAVYQLAYSKEWQDHGLKMLDKWHKEGVIKMKFLLTDGAYHQPKTIPLVILNFNQMTYTINLINWWNYYTDFAPVYVVDSASTYPKLLDFYKNMPFNNVTVIEHEYNKGALLLREFVHGYIHENYDYYVLSNPDICPHPAIPENFMEILRCCIDEYKYDHAGFILKTDDIPDFYNKKEEVLAWEKQWFKKPTKITYNNKTYKAFEAPIDLTFAMYKTANGGWMRHDDKKKWANSIRIFEAFHYGWYVPHTTSIPENRYYFRTARRQKHRRDDLHGGVNHWIPYKA